MVSIFGDQPCDIVRVSLIAPDGKPVAENAMVIDGNMAQWFAFTGRKRRGEARPEGVYREEYRLILKASSAKRPMLAIDREITVECSLESAFNRHAGSRLTVGNSQSRAERKYKRSGTSGHYL